MLSLLYYSNNWFIECSVACEIVSCRCRVLSNIDKQYFTYTRYIDNRLFRVRIIYDIKMFFNEVTKFVKSYLISKDDFLPSHQK